MSLVQSSSAVSVVVENLSTGLRASFVWIPFVFVTVPSRIVDKTLNFSHCQVVGRTLGYYDGGNLGSYTGNFLAGTTHHTVAGQRKRIISFHSCG